MQRVQFCESCCKPYALQGSGKPVGQRIPKLLDCSHTFCHGCVTKLSGSNSRGVKCPTCEEQTLLSGGKQSIKDLPTNLYILGILINNVRANIEKDISKGELTDFELEKSCVIANSCGGATVARGVTAGEGSPREETVETCEECCTNAAVSQCKKCEAIFCESCFNTVHSSSRTLRLHEATPIEFVCQTGGLIQTCEIHEGKELEFYDQTDKKLICSLCIVTPHYQSLEIVPVHMLTDEITEKLKESLQKVKSVDAQLRKSKGMLMSQLPKIKTEFSETVQNIQQHFQDLHTKLQAREVNLIKEVRGAFCNQSFQVDVANEIDQRSEELSKLIKEVTVALSTPSMVMENGETLLSRMVNLEDVACILSDSFMQDRIKISYPRDFQDTLKSYGTIIPESCDVKLKRISEQPNEIIHENNALEAAAPTNEKSEDASSSNASQTGGGSAILTMPSRQNLVNVSHIVTPCNFYIQHVADQDKLNSLMDGIHNHCERAKGSNDAVRTTKVGDLVCAKGDGDEWWYRARIIGEEQQASVPKGRSHPIPKVKVCFIDYGNTAMVPLNRLRKIPSKFIDLPELATNCSLVDIVPPGKCNTWPNESIKAFGSMIRDKHLLMAVVRKSGGQLIVDLKSPDQDGSIAGDKPASVRDALVFLEVANFTSPASVQNPEVAFPVRTYPKVTLPEEGASLQVTVAEAQSPEDIYVVKYDEKEYEKMLIIQQQMMDVYNSMNGDQWQIGWPYKDMVCAAKYSNDQNWYRALVTDVSSDKHVQVFFVDFGNSEELPFNKIRRLPDHLAKLPGQAMRCRLAMVEPVNPEEGWLSECKDFLYENCFQHPYQMKVLEVEAHGDQPMSVVLYLPQPHQTSLNQLLVVNSHAVLSSSADSASLETADVVEPSSPASNASTRMSETDTDAAIIGTEGGRLLYPQRLSYKPVDMPEGNQFQFLVTFVEKDCIISGVQPDKRDNSLADLMLHMRNTCKDTDDPPVTQDQLFFNQPCCAKYSDDNHWYRAQVIGFPAPSTVLLDYVDFGNKEEVPLENISLKGAFLDIPKQCISIQLEGLPRTPVEQEKVSKLLEGLLVGQTCKAARSANVVVDGVVNIEHLTLPDGRDVVATAREMMSKQNPDELEEKPVLSQSRKQQTHLESPQSERRMKRRENPRLARSILADTVLPAEGVPFDVGVTQINSKNVVFLQREVPCEDRPKLADGFDPTHVVACNHIQQLLSMSNRINLKNYFNGKPGLDKVWPNMLCCARYTEDDLWYRAQIIRVLSNVQVQARVLYVDYGTSEVIGLDRMKPFPAELAALPKQAFKCTVVGLGDENYEIGDHSCGAGNDEDDGDDSDDDDINLLANAVVGKKLICKVVSFGPPVVVELYERVLIDESYQDIPISQTLSMLDDVTSDRDSDVIEETQESVELNENEEKIAEAAKDECEDDFTVDVNPEGDWYSECEESFVKYDREGMATRPQLLTPAQFFLKKEGNTVENEEKSVEVEEESEVD
ncbi:tudor domain-containing protein 1-like [Dendronephthya gigantea]|uniref:tudor domain-containing protein 1-like n=1 Tax=Dendronephthya gigantea TaxID=151771 RepID=UPI00106D74E9|nr:tudor domain-containing protein 1-like [Dendronephthya gigantea]